MIYETIPWLNYLVITLSRIRGLVLWLAILYTILWLYDTVLHVIGTKLVDSGKIEKENMPNLEIIKRAAVKSWSAAFTCYIIRFLLPSIDTLKEIAEWIAERL